MDKIIMYAPKGELQDSIQASGVLDISDLSRKEIKNLAKKAAGWSGENGTFSWQDVASGQADVQGKFTRHEDLFKRKFNKQLAKNIESDEKRQLIEDAKNGDITALGKYQAKGTEDVAKILAPIITLPVAAGTGILGTLAGGVKSIYANPFSRTALDLVGTADGIKNAFTNNGIKKTINLTKEGDAWGAVKSGAGDLFNLLSVGDLYNGFRAIKNFKPVYKFTRVKDIGDGGLRWKSVNDSDINRRYRQLVQDNIVTDKTVQDIAQRTGSTQAKKIAVDYGERVQDYADYVYKSYASRHPEAVPTLMRDGMLNTKLRLSPNKPLSQSQNKIFPLLRLDQTVPSTTIIGFSPTRHEFYRIPSTGEMHITNLANTVGHEIAHNALLFNTHVDHLPKGIRELHWKPMEGLNTYTYNKVYDYVPQRWKDLLTPVDGLSTHDLQLNEGFSDLWGTKTAMYDMGIGKHASFDPTKKYNYFDLFKYKMTPTGMTDRFIRQRGGWWKGWKQQLDALNEIYKNGGKLNE